MTKTIKKLHKKIKQLRKDLRENTSALLAIQQEQAQIMASFEKHIAYHIDGELNRSQKDSMCH